MKSFLGRDNKLYQKLSSAIFTIRRIKTISTQPASKTACYALFESDRWYSTVVCGASTARNKRRLLILQKKSVRPISGLDTRDNCRQALKDLRILTALCLYIIETILHTLTKDLLAPRQACLPNKNCHKLCTTFSEDSAL